jgi:3-oxoadipate enol-lactonase
MTQSIDANGTSIAFARQGSGPPLILIHGAEADHSMFDAFAVLLAPHFEVVAYDQRDSGGTRNPAAPYGLDDLADDTAGLIATLGYDRAHVFGTSLGGAIAQVLAMRHPERIDRLALSSTFRVGTPPLSINPEVFTKLGTLRAGLPDTAAEIARYFFSDEHIARHPGVIGIFSGSKRSDEQKQRRAGILARPIAVDLGRIVAPTLVLAAAEDRLIPPAHTLSLAKEIRGALTATIAGVGHVATIEDPAAVASKVIAFLGAAETTKTIRGNDHDRAAGGSRRAL